MTERTDGAERGWRDLGKYRVLAMPLPTNEYFTTHRIFLNGALIGRQLSVPGLDDCRWFECRQGEYATAKESKSDSSWQLRIRTHKRGRPTNAERSARQAEDRRIAMGQLDPEAVE